MYLINANSGKEIFPDRKSLNNKVITKGTKWREWNGNQYESTGNLSLDMVLQCVDFYRNRKRPLKSITLSNYHYDRLDDFLRINYMKKSEYEELCDDGNEFRKFQIDGVPINRAGLLNVKDLSCEFYPTFEESLHMTRHDDNKKWQTDLNDLKPNNFESNIVRNDARPEL